ncbi:MAG: elongation factor G [Ignavibacteriae bacterium]|nr:elongation factor G [Ignavibacteriota bacterium]
MSAFTPDAIRNIAFVGHGGSGKTSLSEFLLFSAGEINRIGTVAEGTTTSDFNPNEIERQISISASALHLIWKNTKINLLDSPGYSDFIGAVKSSLHVVDTAIVVLKGMEGVEVGTESAWEYIQKLNLPAAVMVNKLDNEHSNFDKTVEVAKERLSHDIAVVSFPVNEGPNFNSVIDIIKMKKFTFGDPKSKKVTEEEIPAQFKEKADKLREELLEKVAESTEELMNKFFEEGTLSDADFAIGLKNAIISRSLIPLFAVSAEKGVGLADFADFVVEYLPAPCDRKPVPAIKVGSEQKVEIKCDPKGEPALLVFKSLSEAHVGELSVFKVYSGKLTPGLDMFNEERNKPERLGQLYVLNGHNRTEVTELLAGDIGAVVKLKDTHTNNTLCSKELGIILPHIEFPNPVIRGAVIPKAKGDEDKISSGLHTVHEEDPTLQVKFDPELSQTIISGQGELQLTLATKLLKDRYKVEVDLVEPRIPYRETVRGICENAEYKHKKQSGGRGQFGHVFIKVEPMPQGGGFEFVNAIVGGVIPGRFIPAVDKGIREILDKGILTGSKVVDIKVTLFDGNFHNVDSDEVSFKIAGSQAFKKGFLAANPVLLEPIYELSIKVPEEFMGDVMGDISSRRGKISGMDAEGPFQIIKAKVPLADLYKYSTQLRSLTSGRGIHSREFSHYEPVPKDVEAKVIEEYNKSKQEE